MIWKLNEAYNCKPYNINYYDSEKRLYAEIIAKLNFVGSILTKYLNDDPAIYSFHSFHIFISNIR